MPGIPALRQQPWVTQVEPGRARLSLQGLEADWEEPA
jgi:hypothetical protein